MYMPWELTKFLMDAGQVVAVTARIAVQADVRAVVLEAAMTVVSALASTASRMEMTNPDNLIKNRGVKVENIN